MTNTLRRLISRITYGADNIFGLPIKNYVKTVQSIIQS
jgi:hypothetical protein